MSTAQDIIKGALRHAAIIEDESDMTDSQLADGLSDLNDWGSLYEASSLALGFVRMSAATDTINIPVEAEALYKTNLAVYLLAQYGMPIDPILLTNAANMEKMALIVFQPLLDVDFPDTLPFGSGNYTTEDDRFFPQNKDVNF